MKEIAISGFKEKCWGILEQVRETRKPIRVTRFGEPVAEGVPPSPGKRTGRRLASMIGTAEIIGDIVGPTGGESDWEAFQGMKLLLDTHIWLWSALKPDRIVRRVARELANPENELWLLRSASGNWPFCQGRLRVADDLSAWVAKSIADLELTEAPLTVDVALALS